MHTSGSEDTCINESITTQALTAIGNVMNIPTAGLLTLALNLGEDDNEIYMMQIEGKKGELASYVDSPTAKCNHEDFACIISPVEVNILAGRISPIGGAPTELGSVDTLINQGPAKSIAGELSIPGNHNDNLPRPEDTKFNKCKSNGTSQDFRAYEMMLHESGPCAGNLDEPGPRPIRRKGPKLQPSPRNTRISHEPRPRRARLLPAPHGHPGDLR